MRQSMALGKRNVLAASVLGGLAAFCSPAYATTQTFNDTITGLGGHVTLTSGAGTVTVTLSDTFATPSSLANLLSDLAFSVTGGTAVSATNYSAPNTSFITLTDNQPTAVSGPGTSNPWTLSGSGSYLFTGLNGGDQTRTLIIGPVASDYCTAPANHRCPDGLGGGNQNFNPYINQTATFTLAIPGVTSGSTFSNVGFSYGTAGEISTIPIPAAAWLFVSGLLGLIGIARRKVGPASTSLAAA